MASLKLSPSFDGFSYLINIHKLPRKTSIKVLKSDEYPPFTPRQAIMLAQLLSVALTACVKATDTVWACAAHLSIVLKQQSLVKSSTFWIVEG